MKNPRVCRVFVDKKGNKRCACCNGIVDIKTIVDILRAELGMAGKEVGKHIYEVSRYLREGV